MRKNFLVINTYSSLAYQAVTVACGFILPRLILVHYGSAVNGLVNSIIQFLGVITYLDFGITAVVQSALYKPLAEKNMNEVSQIIASAGNFFRRIAYALIIYICILIYMFPNIINADFSSTYMGILIVAISINLFANYYFGLKNQLLIAADQKIYITYLVQIFTLIVNTLLCAILIECDMSIQFVYSATATIFLIRPLYYWMYVNQHYQLKKKIKLTVEPIKQKWNGIAQHIAAVVVGGTDSIVLTLFSTLENVSIYAVYYLVINGLVKLFVSSTTGFQSHYGMLWAEHRIGELLKSFNRFVWGIHTGVIFIFGCTSILIVPFVKVYTNNITDTNYDVPLFAVFITLVFAMYCIRLPFHLMVLAGNRYKATQTSYIITAAINILLSVLLVKKYGIVGVAIGTLVSMVYHTVWLAFYNSRHLIKWPLKKFKKRILVDCISCIPLFELIGFFELTELSYLAWIFLAVKVACIWGLWIVIVNVFFYPGICVAIWRKIKR